MSAHPRVLHATGLVVALVAAGGLLAYPQRETPPVTTGRLSLEAAWPDARLGQFPGSLPDGRAFHPEAFLDVRTAIGTATSADGDAELLLRYDGTGEPRELRRLPTDQNPVYGTVTTVTDGTTANAAGTGPGSDATTGGNGPASTVGGGSTGSTPGGGSTGSDAGGGSDGSDGSGSGGSDGAGGVGVVWSESVDGGEVTLWGAAADGSGVRQLTADTGNPVFSSSEHDLVVAGGRVWWAAAERDDATQLRSVALGGGPVRVREVPGAWSLTGWPWLADSSGDQPGTRTLREIASGREVPVASSPTELATCSAAWCRVLVLTSDDVARIDAMRPDGSQRRRIAGAGARAALNDVAALDRFELLSEPGPASDLTGEEGLLLYDLGTGRTVQLNPAVIGAFSRNGLAWWATGDQETPTWHVLDLRTL